jgi:curved DNA-binding protein CbpA
MAVPVYYRVLGLDPDATDQDIQDAFRGLSALYQTDGTLENALAARRLRLIGEAYSVLGDPVRRAVYDAQLTGPRTRSPEPLTRSEASTAPPISAEEPISESAPVAASPTEGSRRPTLLGRLRRRPFRSMGVVVAVTFVLLGAWARPQRPSTDIPLGSPPSVIVPTADTPLVAAIGRASPSAVASRSPRQGNTSANSRTSPAATKAAPLATRGPTSHSAPPSATTPVPTQSVTHHSVQSAVPPSAKGSRTPAAGNTPTSNSTPSRKPTHLRSQGGSDRAHPTAGHGIVDTLAMAYKDYPDAPLMWSMGCAAPQRRSVMLPFQIGRQPGVTGQPRQTGLQARATRPSPFWSGRPARPSLAWIHSPARGRDQDMGVPHPHPQARARIVQA